MLANNLTLGDWNFTGNTGPQRTFLPAAALMARSLPGEVLKLHGLTFAECDFQGAFSHQPSMMFDQCRFHKCHFAFSSWRFTTFRSCEFKECSFALSSFDQCEFRDCTWLKNAFSGSKTDLEKTFITNPTAFIASGYSGTDPARSSDLEHAAYQSFRLAESKAHLARSILYSHEIVGDDDTFYETAKLHDLCQISAKTARANFRVRFPKSKLDSANAIIIPLFWLEYMLRIFMGLINGWGSSLFRPLFGLALTSVLAASVYQYIPLGAEIKLPWQKAFDIANIAGYGNQVDDEQPVVLRLVEGVQLLISIVFYTVFFSTAVSRNSRSR